MQLNTGQIAPGDAGNDLNVVPAWIQGVTGCNSVVAIVDDGKIVHCIGLCGFNSLL